MAIDWGKTIPDLINTGLNIYDANQTTQGLTDAYEIAASGIDQGINTLGQAYQEGKDMLAPYLGAGSAGIEGYLNYMNNPQQVTSLPGYQFGLEQGEKAIGRAAAARGLNRSGNVLGDFGRYNQQYAQNFLDQSLDRYTPLMGLGQSATQTMSRLGQNYSAGLSNLYGARAQQLSNIPVAESAGTSSILETGANLLQTGKKWWDLGQDFLSGSSAAAGTGLAGTAASNFGLTGLGGTASALGTGGGIGAGAIGGGSVGANALGINATNFPTFGYTPGATGVAGSQAATAVANNAVAAGATPAAASSWAATAMNAGMLGLGLTVGYKIISSIFGDKKRYTDAAEDELAKKGNPVLAATQTYAASLADPNATWRNQKDARWVMMDTINNPKNTTNVKTAAYADFVWTGVKDILNGTWNGEDWATVQTNQNTPNSTFASWVGGNQVGDLYGGRNSAMNWDFVNDTGKALYAIYGKNSVTKEIKSLIEGTWRLQANLIHDEDVNVESTQASIAARKSRVTQLFNQLQQSQPYNLQVQF